MILTDEEITKIKVSDLPCIGKHSLERAIEQAVLDKLNMTPDKMRKLDNILTEIYSWGASTERSGYYDPDEAQESIKEYTNQIISLCQPSPDKVRRVLEQFNGILNESQIDYIVKEICGG